MITRKEICQLYGICFDTLRERLHAIGITHSKLIAPIEFELFKVRYGAPLDKRKLFDN